MFFIYQLIEKFNRLFQLKDIYDETFVFYPYFSIKKFVTIIVVM